MDVLQITRSHTTHRKNYAWWNAKMNEGGEWVVHFHADRVPSKDWTAQTTHDLIAKIEIEMGKWCAVLDARWDEMRENRAKP